MATVDQHLEQWKHNRRFAKTIDAQYRDWQINVIFYTALHLIDAALASLRVPVTNHTDRNNAVQTNGSFAPVRDQYMDLYRISRITRYDADPDLWIPEEFLAVADLAEQLLRPIEDWIGPFLKKPIKFEKLPLKS